MAQQGERAQLGLHGFVAADRLGQRAILPNSPDQKAAARGWRELAECVSPARGQADVPFDCAPSEALIAQAKDGADKLALAQKLATRRLASGVVPELDECFAAPALR